MPPDLQCVAEDKIVHWGLIPELAVFLQAPYDQRTPILTQLGDDSRVDVGACPGLSIEWIKRHRQQPNESARSRMDWMRKDGILWQAADHTVNYNKGLGGKRCKTNLERVQQFDGYLGARAGVMNEHHKPADAAESKLYKTFFNRTNAYFIVIANLSGIGVDHTCAAYCYSSGFLKKKLVFFDSNFGEFAIPLTSNDMHAFMTAWKKQFTTYVSGRRAANGMTVRRSLTLDKVQIIPLL